MARESKRNQWMLLLLLLAIAGGAGAWNYQRNVAAEKAEYRPFRTYAEADLESLATAFRSDLDSSAGHYQAAKRGKVAVRDGALLGDQVREFERVQHISRRKRELAGRVAEQEAMLREVEKEQARRGAEKDKLKFFFKRENTTFSIIFGI